MQPVVAVRKQPFSVGQREIELAEGGHGARSVSQRVQAVRALHGVAAGVPGGKRLQR
jgi:hypothetical protein